MPPTPERLAAALRALPLTVAAARSEVTEVALPTYPGGRRPNSIVTLTGAGAVGHGEHVGWTQAAHEHCRTAVVPRLTPGRFTLGAWCADLVAVTDDGYARAALEAAAVDLALAQAGTTPFALVDMRASPVRYVVSLGRTDDVLGAAAAEPDAELKLDADTAWGAEQLAALAGLGRVAVVDWKTTGTSADHGRLAAALPDALIEDPGAADGPWALAPWAMRVSADGWLAAPADLDALSPALGAVNVKVGRMGGVLPTLDLAARAAARGIRVYVGGMFETGPGRRQAQTLAALLSPDGPNDVAPLAIGSAPAERPARLRVHDRVPGFGSER